MERCPNCGAPARSGAKFCTTCGYRLTNDETEQATAAAPDPSTGEAVLSADPFVPAWPPPATDASPEESDPDGPDDLMVSSPDPGPEDTLTEPEPDLAAEAADAAPADHVLSSSWPTAPSEAPAWSQEWGTPAPAPAPEANVPDASRPFSPVPDPLGESSADAAVSWPPPIAGDGPESGQVAAPWSEGEASASLQEDDSAATENPDHDVAGSLDIPPPQDQGPTLEAIRATFTTTPEARPIASSAAAPATPWDAPEVAADDEQGDVDRALALLDELRLLVPRLGSPPPGVDLDLVAADLAQAATPAPGARSDFSELRSAMQNARDRPRDIDTVLDLSRQVEDVDALLDAYDRMRAAIDGAVDALRSGPAGD